MPPARVCAVHDSHQKTLDDHESRIRKVEMNQAKNGARVALIAAGASLIGNFILMVVAGIIIYYVTQGG